MAKDTTMMSAYRVVIIDAVGIGQIDTVKRLISQGYDVNEQTELGTSAVFAAVLRNDPEILILLIEAGAKVDVEDCFGRTPLSYAKKHGYTKIIKILEEKIFDLD